MAVLARVNYVAQQRLDLSHLSAADSYTAFDFRSLITMFTGSDIPYVLRGLSVIGTSGLSITVDVQDSLVFNPLDDNGSFYRGLPSDSDIVLSLPANQSTIFIEATFANQTQIPVDAALWNPLATNGAEAAGNEYTSAVNSQNVITLEITSNTVGFTAGSIPLLEATTSGTQVTALQDARYSLFRLGTGGVTPDPTNRFNWSPGRKEPVVSGPGVGNATNSSFLAEDSTGVLNDKGITTFKEWMDAVMTRILEIAGGTVWYDNGLAANYVQNLNMNTLYFDTSGGHSIQASTISSFYWSKNGDSILRGEGTIPITWQSNYGFIQWSLGGTFASNAPGGSRGYSNPNFASAVVPNGSNVYLLFEREVAKGSGNNLSWASNAQDTNLVQAQSISGVAGDFVGIAIGDFVRKQSEGISQYYQVGRMSNGVTITSASQYIADSSIVAIELTAVISSGASTEPLRYWRSNYSSADVYVDPANQHPYQDINFFWLGRCNGTEFYLRDFGQMTAGQDVTTLETQFTGGETGSGSPDIILQHASLASINGAGYYGLKSGASTTLLTIYHRKQDNAVAYPGSTNNAGASLVYTINAPVGLMNNGDGLWVKLSDTIGGALANGPVASNATDPENDPTVATNRWQVLPAAQNPLRNLYNQNVYLIARCTVVNGQPVLAFMDGSELSAWGSFQVNDSEFAGQVLVDQQIQFKTYATGMAPIPYPVAGNLNVFVRSGYVWQQDYLGNETLLTNNPPGNIYEEPVTVIASGSPTNNQMVLPGSFPVTINLPLDSRNSLVTRTYIVGSGELEVYLNGQVWTRGADWAEVGSVDTASSQIQIISPIVVGDVITYRIDADGGVVYINGAPPPLVSNFSNVGAGTGLVFQQLNSTIADLRTIQAGSGISVVTATDRIILSMTGGAPTGYFRNDVTGITGELVPTGAIYNIASQNLAVFRNGARMYNTVVQSTGLASDRYQEAANTYIITDAAGQAVSSDVFSFVNQNVQVTYSVVITGQTTTILNVPTYTMGNNSLKVWRNGDLLNASGLGGATATYTETTTTSITLGQTAVSTDVFVVEAGPAPTSRLDASSLSGTVLTVPTYTMGNQTLLVYRNGLLMYNSGSLGTADEQYSETSVTTITLALAASGTDVFTYWVK